MNKKFAYGSPPNRNFTSTIKTQQEASSARSKSPLNYNQNKVLIDQLSKLQEDNKKITIEGKKYQSQLKQQALEIKQLQDQIKNLKKETKILCEEYKKVQNPNMIQSEQNFQSARGVQGHYQSVNNELSKLKQDYVKLQIETKDQHTLIKQYEKQIAAYKTINNYQQNSDFQANGNGQKDNIKGGQDYQQLQKQNELLMKENQKILAENKLYYQQLDDIQQKYNTLIKDKSNFQNENKVQNPPSQNNSQTNTQVQQLQNENKQLKIECQQYNDQLIELQNNYKVLSQKVNQTKLEDDDGLEIQNQELIIKIRQLEQQMGVFQQSSSQQALNPQEEQPNNNNQDLIQEYKSLEIQYQQLLENNQTINNQLQQLTDVNRDIQAKLQSQTDQIQEKDSQINNLNIKLNQLETQFQSLQNDLQAKINNLQTEQQHNLEQQIKLQEAQVKQEKLQQLIITLQQEIDKQKEIVDEHKPQDNQQNQQIIDEVIK